MASLTPVNYNAADEIIFGNVNRLRFIQIPSKQLKTKQDYRYITVNYFFTADIMFGFSMANIKVQLFIL